jgi:hypothetical protein
MHAAFTCALLIELLLIFSYAAISQLMHELPNAERRQVPVLPTSLENAAEMLRVGYVCKENDCRNARLPKGK